jgi:hypothetical protein
MNVNSQAKEKGDLKLGAQNHMNIRLPNQLGDVVKHMFG